MKLKKSEKIYYKRIIFLGIFILSVLTGNAQQYLGKDWFKVKAELSALKVLDSNLYLKQDEFDVINKVHHVLNLHQKNEDENKDWVKISTYFNDQGICFREIYTDFKSKENALAQAHRVLKGYKIYYSSSDSSGFFDKYILELNGILIVNKSLIIGSTSEMPDDIMLILTDRNLSPKG